MLQGGNKLSVPDCAGWLTECAMPLYVLKVTAAPASFSRLWVSTPNLYATCTPARHTQHTQRHTQT